MPVSPLADPNESMGTEFTRFANSPLPGADGGLLQEIVLVNGAIVQVAYGGGI
jgi:hypothetical protein